MSFIEEARTASRPCYRQKHQRRKESEIKKVLLAAAIVAMPWMRMVASTTAKAEQGVSQLTKEAAHSLSRRSICGSLGW